MLKDILEQESWRVMEDDSKKEKSGSQHDSCAMPYNTIMSHACQTLPYCFIISARRLSNNHAVLGYTS